MGWEKYPRWRMVRILRTRKVEERTQESEK